MPDFAAIKNTTGELAFYRYENGNPYLSGTDAELPKDMDIALIRAEAKKELPMAVVMNGEAMAELLSKLYEKYNDMAFYARVTENEKKEAEMERGYKDSQMFGY